MATGGSRHNERSAVAMRLRPKDEFTHFLDGLELAPPAYPGVPRRIPAYPQRGPGQPVAPRPGVGHAAGAAALTAYVALGWVAAGLTE